MIPAWEILLLPLPLCYALLVWRLGGALRRLVRESAAVPDKGAALQADPQEGLPEGISVIIPARNEERELPDTLAALLEQDLSPDRWEILLVDDGSVDGTAQLGEEWAGRAAERGCRLRVLRTGTRAVKAPSEACVTPAAEGRAAGKPLTGKKAAITLGVDQAVFDAVAMLDADSRVSPTWLRSLREAYDAETGMLAGGVVFRAPAVDSLFQRMQRLEYMGLLGAGLASLAAGRPYYASGTNLSYRVGAFREAGGYGGIEDVPSGDDTLLIQRLHTRTAWQIAPSIDPAVLVRTRGPAGPREFLRQRVRWSSTEFLFPDRRALAAALLLYLTVLATALLPLLALAGAIAPATAAAAVLLKLVPDLRLTAAAARALGGRELMPLFLPVWFVQVAYGLVVPWFGTFGGFRWRDP